MKKNIFLLLALLCFFSCNTTRKIECISTNSYEVISLENIIKSYSKFSLGYCDEKTISISVDSVSQVFPLSTVYADFYFPNYRTSDTIMAEIDSMKNAEKQQLGLGVRRKMCLKNLNKFKKSNTKNTILINYANALFYKKYVYVRLFINRNFALEKTVIVLKINKSTKVIEKIHDYNFIR
jgi:hypothetical protein